MEEVLRKRVEIWIYIIVYFYEFCNLYFMIEIKILRLFIFKKMIFKSVGGKDI